MYLYHINKFILYIKCFWIHIISRLCLNLYEKYCNKLIYN